MISPIALPDRMVSEVGLEAVIILGVRMLRNITIRFYIFKDVVLFETCCNTLDHLIMFCLGWQTNYASIGDIDHHHIFGADNSEYSRL
jgi:hypothetical protein